MAMTVSLPDELAALVEARVATGRYGSSTDVVREALGLLEEMDRRDTERLQKAWSEGLASGDSGPLDLDELKVAARRRNARGA
jgi:antitoxin ParD1/3/4